MAAFSQFYIRDETKGVSSHIKKVSWLFRQLLAGAKEKLDVPKAIGRK